MERITFSIIVPSVRPDRLGRLLGSLKNKLTEGDEILVIVSSASAYENLTTVYTEARFLCCTKPGPACARNAAIRVARGSHLIFLDDDAIASEKLLGTYRRAYQDHPEAMGIAGNIRHKETGGILGWYFAAQPFTWKHSSRLFVSCNFSVRNTGLTFDERFDFSCEDVAFSLNFRKKEIIFLKEAWVYHDIPEDLIAFCLKYFRYGLGRARFARLYGGLPKVRKFQLPFTLQIYFRRFPLPEFLLLSALELLKYLNYYSGYLYDLLKNRP
ncbi:MAG: glycosyltransferase [Candidatus Wallbacteria bacterium]|nr:glycosyltransferase [Candidatus Wallbacteria bacterium]